MYGNPDNTEHYIRDNVSPSSLIEMSFLPVMVDKGYVLWNPAQTLVVGNYGTTYVMYAQL